VRPDPDELARVPLFDSLAAAELRKVAASMEVRQYEPGDRIISEGASGYAFFLLQSGAAAVTRADDEIAVLGPGDFFGELAITGNGRRTATVVATTPARLAVMFGSEFRLLEQVLPATAE
jgi:CRP-like cAMP-binding protein